VPWDLNTRSAEARLAPFAYDLAEHPGVRFEITQRKAAANEVSAD
jgi:hypothetical protein